MFKLFSECLLLLQIALGNILKFRKKNWRFDVIGGVVYFILVFSMFPQVRHLELPIRTSVCTAARLLPFISYSDYKEELSMYSRVL